MPVLTIAEELFRGRDVRARTPEERLYRLVELVLDECDVSTERLTWDWYDSSVEIYVDGEVPDNVDLGRLFDAGFARVWLHPFRCSKDGRRDHDNCRCPCHEARLRPTKEGKEPR